MPVCQRWNCTHYVSKSSHREPGVEEPQDSCLRTAAAIDNCTKADAAYGAGVAKTPGLEADMGSVSSSAE
jgi:hypothetical protein